MGRKLLIFDFDDTLTSDTKSTTKWALKKSFIESYNKKTKSPELPKKEDIFNQGLISELRNLKNDGDILAVASFGYVDAIKYLNDEHLEKLFDDENIYGADSLSNNLNDNWHDEKCDHIAKYTINTNRKKEDMDWKVCKNKMIKMIMAKYNDIDPKDVYFYDDDKHNVAMANRIEDINSIHVEPKKLSREFLLKSLGRQAGGGYYYKCSYCRRVKEKRRSNRKSTNKRRKTHRRKSRSKSRSHRKSRRTHRKSRRSHGKSRGTRRKSRSHHRKSTR